MQFLNAVVSESFPPLHALFCFHSFPHLSWQGLIHEDSSYILKFRTHRPFQPLACKCSPLPFVPVGLSIYLPHTRKCPHSFDQLFLVHCLELYYSHAGHRQQFDLSIAPSCCMSQHWNRTKVYSCVLPRRMWWDAIQHSSNVHNYATSSKVMQSTTTQGPVSCC